MAEEISSPKGSAPAGHNLRKSFTASESRIESPSKRSSLHEPLSPTAARRRSSTFSTESMRELRDQFQSSTDDLLAPRAAPRRHDEPSHWHSVPLAFALLPAVGGILFQNGSAVVTDILLLGLAAIFLNWSVRIPWDWYHSSQEVRRLEEYKSEALYDDESGDDNSPHEQLDDVPEDQPLGERDAKGSKRREAREKAAKELRAHEVLALIACFLFPLTGAYLLHSIRGYLSRPSEGLVSNFNLIIFLMAAELRPLRHLVKMLQARTLHLQRVVAQSLDDEGASSTPGGDRNLLKRIEELEARVAGKEAPTGQEVSDIAVGGKQAALITTEVRRSVQPELDALNRAVRRYEKRATLQTMQTESRLLDIEARLGDAITLAAAAASVNQQHRAGVTTMLIEWIGTGMVLPLQAFGALATLPFRTMIAIIDFGKTRIMGSPPSDRGRRSTGSKLGAYARVTVERPQGKASRRL